MNLIIFAALVVALGPKTVFAHNSANAAICEARLNLELIAQNRLGFLPEFSSAKVKPFSGEAGVERFILTAKHPQFKMDLAFLDYEVFDGGKTLEIEKVDVLNSNNSRKGLSNVLFAHMLMNQPNAKRIRTNLYDVNLRMLLAAMGPDTNCVQAFARTPLYQTAIHFGFTKISGTCNPATNEYNFVMEH
jgi:hypothetical protein